MKATASSVEHDAEIVGSAARRINTPADCDPLVETAGRAQCVLIGEASHGTDEFYATRADLTRRLIAEKGFRAIALGADWPDTSRIHRFVTGREQANSAGQALRDFRRFPAWMWRNTVMVGICHLAPAMECPH